MQGGVTGCWQQKYAGFKRRAVSTVSHSTPQRWSPVPPRCYYTLMTHKKKLTPASCNQREQRLEQACFMDSKQLHLWIVLLYWLHHSTANGTHLTSNLGPFLQCNLETGTKGQPKSWSFLKISYPSSLILKRQKSTTHPSYNDLYACTL